MDPGDRTQQEERQEQPGSGAIMKTPVEIRVNRTGMSFSPELGEELIEAALSTKPSAPGDEHGMSALRMTYARDAAPVGSIPLPVQEDDDEEVDVDVDL